MSKNKVVFRFVSISFSILVLLLVFIGVYKASAFCYEFGYRIFSETPVDAEPGDDIVVQIHEGDSAIDIGETLEEKGLIRDSWLYVARYYLSAYVDDINPGTYVLNTSMTAKEMMIVMSAEAEDTEEEDTEEEDIEAEDTEKEDTEKEDTEKEDTEAEDTEEVESGT